jgi:putative transposase
MKYRFIDQNRHRHEVGDLCEALGLSPSASHRWREGEPSLRQQHKESILELHGKSRGRYGHRPIYYHLLEEGVNCGRDRTLRLMKELELEGIQRKRFKPLGTNSEHDFGYSANLFKELGKPTPRAAIRSGWLIQPICLPGMAGCIWRR